MALPKLEIPQYEVKLPSTGKAVLFRPFTVRERAVLLTALQDENTESIMVAIENLFKVCTFGVCQLYKMPIVDAEFLFINIQKKSIGEELQVIHNCECGKSNEVVMNLDKIAIAGKYEGSNIEIDSGVWIKMRYPSFKDSSILSNDDPTEDQVLTVIATCVEGIIKGDEVYTPDSIEEAKEFISLLTQPQLSKIEAFFASIPKMVLDQEYVCPECKKTNNIHLEGLGNFFG